jgi:hypothetical protein
MKETVTSNKFRFDFRIFSILMLLAVVPLLLGSWLLFGSYQEAYLDMVGAHLGESAEMAFGLIDNYLQHQIIAVAGLAEVPTLRDAVRTGNEDLRRNLDDVRKAIPAMESSWSTLDRKSPQLRSILDNTASDFLRRYISIEKTYREIMVTDFLGRLVAATGKTSDYYQADEDWWKETYGDGRRGSVHIGDVKYDESAKAWSMELAQPFVEPEDGVIGVIKVVLDAQDIHRLIGSMRAGPSTTAALIRAKGDVISAPGFGLMDRTYPATLDILNAREKGKRYMITTSSPPFMLGLTPKNFQDVYPHLNWIVVTTGPVNDLLGPLPQHSRYFVALVVVILLLSLVATLVLSRVESRPALEQDPHLEAL